MNPRINRGFFMSPQNSRSGYELCVARASQIQKLGSRQIPEKKNKKKLNKILWNEFFIILLYSQNNY
jgi:hypothetical protein